MKIVFFGLTITSSWGNGHATTYRSLCKALSHRGHQIYFIEKDVEWYRNNRDLPQPDFCTVTLYEDWSEDVSSLLLLCRDADAIVIGSYFPNAVAATERLLDAGCNSVLFYDIDTPITMTQLRAYGGNTYLDATLIPYYAAYLSFTGGPVLQELQNIFHAQMAIPFYCSVDEFLYRPTKFKVEYRCDLSYLGTYAADRQPKLMSYLNGAACLLADSRFIVAGPLYPPDTCWNSNVERIIHLSPPEHPLFYSSSKFTLNLTRNDMIDAGYSPSVRLFEASACGTAILSDSWAGLESFFTPGEEILLPKDEYEVASLLRDLSDAKRVDVGRRARERILAHHTSNHRAQELEDIIAGLPRR